MGESTELEFIPMDSQRQQKGHPINESSDNAM